ncbi:MAG: hypothetical protein Tsb0020_18110 [Haliangiales bacterium]
MMRKHTRFNYESIAGHIPPKSSVLDIGAWDGLLGAELHRGLGCEVLNVDVVDKNKTELPFLVFDGESLPLADDHFERVLLMYVLHHSANDMALLREARRVCAPDGRVLVGEDMVEGIGQRLITVGFHIWLWTFTFMGWSGKFRRVEEWRARFERAGLEVEEVVLLGPHMGKRLWPRNMLFVLRRR